MIWQDKHISWLQKNDSLFESRSHLTEAFNKTFDTNVTVRAVEYRCRKLSLNRQRGFHCKKDGHAFKSLQIGAETVRKTGSTGKPMWFVKVSNDLCGGENKSKAPYCWEKKHLIIWRAKFGDIPKGYKVVFLNRNTLDCRLENLYLVSDAVHIMMIKYNWYSEEPILTLAALKCCELELLTKGHTT